MKYIVFIFLVLLSSNIFADCSGEFTPMINSDSPFTQVHFFPKKGNKILINNKYETIPPGIGVISGGVIGTYNDASIDKHEHKKLKGSTLYYVYVYMKDKTMKMDFSQIGHKESVKYGNQIHFIDPTRSLIGMVYTTPEGKFLGSNRSQLTTSWCNRGHTGLVQQLEGASTNSKKPKEINVNYRLEWLQWGINNTFKQGFTTPNIYVATTVQNSQLNCAVEVSVGIDNDKSASFNGIYTQISPVSYGYIGSTVVGANGTNEGYHFATFLMSTVGTCGTAIVKSGAIYSSPLES